MQPSLEGPADATLTVARSTTAATAMLRTFARAGVRAAFGIPGGLISPIYDGLAQVRAIQLVSTRHETIAGFAAMGHAIATGVPALVFTTAGPGITNMVTAMAAALAEEIPMIVIGGEVGSRSTSRGGFQDSSTNSMSIVSMLRNVTRWSVRVEDAAGAVGAAAQAVKVATGRRPGPVFLSLPIDVGNLAALDSTLAIGEPEIGIAPNVDDCASIAAALVAARRPLLIVGNGARTAANEIRELAERLRIPVVTTAHGKGIFPESHPLHLGVMGFGGHPSAVDYIKSDPDVVCVIGTRLGDFATDGWSLPIAGTVATFQIDREPWLIGRNYPVTLGVVADAALTVRTIIGSLPGDMAMAAGSVSDGIRKTRPESANSDAVPLKPARVLRALQEAFPNAFWTSDIGEHCAHAVHELTTDRPDQFRAMLGIASMGSGIGVGIGARHARRDRPVVCICGDGGFAMHPGDVLTCVEEGIDVIFVIMNDGRWNMVQHGFAAVFGRAPASLPAKVADLAQVARGFGAIGVTIATPDDLDPARLRRLSELGRPVVLDVRIDGEEALSVGSRSASVKRSAFGGAP